METNDAAVSDIYSNIFRELMMAEGARGAYNRTSGPLGYNTWLSGTDISHLAGNWNLKSAFIGDNNHWKYILDLKQTAQGIDLTEYDPLVGLMHRSLDSSAAINIVMSPELDRAYWRERENGIEITDPDGYILGLSGVDFLEDYYNQNPVSENALNYFRNMEGIQTGIDNCGPLAINGALIDQWASQGRLPPYRINSTSSRDDGDIVIGDEYDSASGRMDLDIYHLDDDLQIEGPFDYDDSLGFGSELIIIEDPLELEFIEIGEQRYVSSNQNLFGKFKYGLQKVKNSLSSKYQSYLNGGDIEIMEIDSSSDAAPYQGYSSSGSSANYSYY